MRSVVYSYPKDAQLRKIPWWSKWHKEVMPVTNAVTEHSFQYSVIFEVMSKDYIPWTQPKLNNILVIATYMSMAIVQINSVCLRLETNFVKGSIYHEALFALGHFANWLNYIDYFFIIVYTSCVMSYIIVILCAHISLQWPINTHWSKFSWRYMSQTPSML